MHWRKSSHSGGGDGDACVEIAELPVGVAIRDSKAPTRATLSVPAASFVAFVEGVKGDGEAGTGGVSR
ncbi:DUF397 domain-containing protein [Streptomyces coelicoflavus]|uniref:DUF397 domain-containing protein n=1 Tax=Streptomyces TaxID=1883 RepID=UPI00129277D8|nr:MULTISPECIES: DUF397 domain-containing protein [Streptomyces]MCX5036441.1 DUF397 domain-containing protein [Streptomyces coelicoflavus]MDI6514694.1 DUF397 domain-containing protein [Streptomyces coelicoflavus]QFX82650.1 DUF397 domain-containing protein [Streptomyces sp. SYP-A7193]